LLADLHYCLNFENEIVVGFVDVVVIEGNKLAVLFSYFVRFFYEFEEQVVLVVHGVKFDMVGCFVVGLYV
jgi:hypothetical protein